MRHFLILLLSITLFSCQADKVMEINLWPDGVPEDNGITEAEMRDDKGSYRNVTTTSITVSLASKDKNKGVTLILCPGGGYQHETYYKEGMDFAPWLNENGINAVVLKYRLPNGHYEIPLKDAQRAIRYIRSKAEEWNLNPDKIGISGFSAGGHLASTALTHFDMGIPNDPDSLNHLSCQPDFGILFYPVISMDANVTHKGSRHNLLGDNPSDELVTLYSNELQVNENTPPTLLFLSHDDRVVIPKNSVDFYTALKNNGIQASLYIFPEGGHGWGFKETFRYHEIFKSLMLDWLDQQKILE